MSIFKKPFVSHIIYISVFKFGINFVSPAPTQPEEDGRISLLRVERRLALTSPFIVCFTIEIRIEIIFILVLYAINYLKQNFGDHFVDKCCCNL